MKVFISWSGERSGRVATALRDWLPRVIQAVEPWISSGSIEPGVRWSDALAEALDGLDYGILCLTPENLKSEWILFEAGALSKTVSKSRVMPYLLGFEPHQLEGPLAQFQAARADKAGTLRILNSLNSVAMGGGLSSGVLLDAFEMW
jgi:hypothetical protein